MFQPAFLAGALAVGVMAQVDLLPFDNEHHLDCLNFDPYEPSTQASVVKTQWGVVIAEIPNREQDNNIQSHTSNTLDENFIYINHTKAKSLSSVPEYHQHHQTLNQPFDTTIYAWPFIATAAALVIRFLITQHESFPIALWVKKVESVDHWHIAAEWLYITENLNTDDWIGFDSFLEWFEILVENVVNGHF